MNDIVLEILEPYFTTQLEDIFDFFESVFYIRNVSIVQNIGFDQLLCGKDMYVERHPEHLSAITYYLSSVLPRIAEKYGIVGRFCQQANNLYKEKKRKSQKSDSTDEKRIRNKVKDPYAITTTLDDNIRENLRRIISSPSNQIRQTDALMRLSLDGTGHSYIILADEPMQLLINMLDSYDQRENAYTILANVFAQPNAPKMNENSARIIDKIIEIGKTNPIIGMNQTSFPATAFFRCIANACLYSRGVGKELGTIYVPQFVSCMGSTSFRFNTNSLRAMACFASIPEYASIFQKSGSLDNRVDKHAIRMSKYVHQWSNVGSPKSPTKAVTKNMFEIEPKALTKVSLNIHPFSKWIQERYDRPSKCVLESPIISTCNGLGDFRILHGKRLQEGTHVTSIVINVSTSIIQECQSEFIGKLGEVDEYVDTLICGVADSKLPYIAYSNVDIDVASRLVHTAERATSRSRQLDKIEKECLSIFSKTDADTSILQYVESFLSRHMKDQSTKPNPFDSFTVWRQLLSNQLFVDFFLQWGDLKEIGVPKFGGELPAQVFSSLDSLSDKTPSVAMTNWITECAEYVARSESMKHHLKSIYTFMALFFHIFEHPQLACTCHSVASALREGKELVTIPAIAAHLERTMYFCRSVPLELSGLVSYYRLYGMLQTTMYIMKAQRREIPMKNFPQHNEIHKLANALTDTIVKAKRISITCPKDIDRLIDHSFNVFVNMNNLFRMKEIFDHARQQLLGFVVRAWDEMEEWDGSSIHAATLPSKKPCAACQKNEGKIRCARCKRLVYCSRSCQEQHWKVHTNECKKTKS
jgi:hypothetical protein